MVGVELCIVCGIQASELTVDDVGVPIMSEADERKDAMDAFNHPRLRRARIVWALQQVQQQKQQQQQQSEHQRDPIPIHWIVPSQLISTQEMIEALQVVHTERLLDFFVNGWSRWVHLCQHGKPSSSRIATPGVVPPLIPHNMPLPRDLIPQQPSHHILGQIGYFCNARNTPLFEDLVAELCQDTTVLLQAIDQAVMADHNKVVYAMPVHPGHHASADSYGGFCYVNSAAVAARHLQRRLASSSSSPVKIAILDVDYHCGNGTASIFYDDPTVMVVSLHCHPDYDYPFHAGYATETGAGAGVGTTLQIPLMPEAKWETDYKPALQRGLQAIRDFEPQALVVSLGLDTLDEDPCTRAGFCLFGQDFVDMGQTMAESLPTMPTIFLQEGGYRFDQLAQACADVLMGFCDERAKMS